MNDRCLDSDNVGRSVLRAYPLPIPMDEVEDYFFIGSPEGI